MTPTTPPVIDYEGSDNQEKFWERGERAYEDQSEAIALRHLLPAEGGTRLLELGAGGGRNTPRYENFTQVVLVDYSITQLEQAVDRLGISSRYRFVAADIYHLPFAPASFDAATMIRTLHHMADPLMALKQVEEALCGQAVFILEYANKRNSKAVVRYLLGRQKWSPFSPEAVEFVKLNFNFHPRTVQGWLNQLGFQVEGQRTVSHFRLGVMKRMLPLKLLVWLDSIFQPTGSLFQLTPSVFLRVRKDQPASAVPELLLFRCPACGFSPIQDAPPLLTCPSCKRAYPIHNGIYDFRLTTD